MMSNLPFVSQDQKFRFEWRWDMDQARLQNRETGQEVWQGSLLPALEITRAGKPAMICPKGLQAESLTQTRLHLVFHYEDLAQAKLQAEVTESGLAFRRFEIIWNEAPVPLRAVYFGASPLNERQRQAAPDFEATFWPDWRAEGFCVPGAKSNPGQSFWRAWDMGHAVLPLGSFGPAMGSPYVAAFPRPTLAAAMGGAAGWFVFGPGSIPDAALSLDIRSSSAWLRLLMREDLWGPPPEQLRVWSEPLRMTWHEDVWSGFERLFQTFPTPPPAKPSAQHSQWGTWGSFKEGKFDLDEELGRAELFGVEALQIDDGWETWVSSGVANLDRFPDFKRQLAAVRSSGLKLAVWQSIGWVARPDEAGLTETDLLCGPDGKPRIGSWSCDPRADQAQYYCLDPSSEKARAFLIERTRRVIRDYEPGLLKLDFGYGLPGPDGAAPRNPAYRGERLCFELLKIIEEAARAENPEVALEFYGIHPLFRSLYDVIALDDLGDMGAYEADGHHQRSIWAALTGSQGAAIMGSSGYYWDAFEEILLNTTILGAPGACMPAKDVTGATMTPRMAARFRALNRWHRKTIGWQPLWLNSHRGDLFHEPRLVCWGRQENGGRCLTALALRDSSSRPDLTHWGIAGWKGRWALLSLTDEGLDCASQIACIPFDDHCWLQWKEPVSTLAEVRFDGKAEVLNALAGKQDRCTVSDGASLDTLMGFLIGR